MIRVNSRIPTQILNLSLSLLKTRRTLKSTLASFPKKKSQTWPILKLTLKFNDTATHPYLNDNDMRLHSDCSRITLHRRLGAQGAKRGPKGGQKGAKGGTVWRRYVIPEGAMMKCNFNRAKSSTFWFYLSWLFDRCGLGFISSLPLFLLSDDESCEIGRLILVNLYLVCFRPECSKITVL